MISSRLKLAPDFQTDWEPVDASSLVPVGGLHGVRRPQRSYRGSCPLHLSIFTPFQAVLLIHPEHSLLFLITPVAMPPRKANKPPQSMSASSLMNLPMTAQITALPAAESLRDIATQISRRRLLPPLSWSWPKKQLPTCVHCPAPGEECPCKYDGNGQVEYALLIGWKVM